MDLGYASRSEELQLQRGGGAQLSSSAARRRQRESDTTPREVGRRLRRALARMPRKNYIQILAVCLGLGVWQVFQRKILVFFARSFFSCTFYKYTLKICSLLGWLRAKIKTCLLKLTIIWFMPKKLVHQYLLPKLWKIT